MRREAADPDIEVSSRIISLKCPLSYTRLQTPCRGSGCKHNQCFDATSYLQLQEQAPTWTCPQCNKPVPWHQLVLDQYVQDILNNTSDDTEQVTIEPDGRWHLGDSKPQASSNKKRKLNSTPDSDDDEDIVLIGDVRPTNTHTSQILTPSSVRTPPVNGREDSVATSNTNRSASKRPRQEVIDLTISDEDDDQDARPAVKRTSTTNLNGSLLGATTMNSANSPAFRPRPPDQPHNNNRYQFNLPPITSPHSFNFNSSSFGGNGNGYGSGGAGGVGSNY
jgi:E3 SUMO-protein ligase PIAS1